MSLLDRGILHFLHATKSIIVKAGEMAPQFRALAALIEDLGWAPSPHKAAHHHLYVTSVPGNLIVSSGLYRLSKYSQMGFCLNAFDPPYTSDRS